MAIVVTTAEEAKSRENNSLLTSSSDEGQPNKRLADYGKLIDCESIADYSLTFLGALAGSSPTLNSGGFKPITGSYSSANNYAGNPQYYPSATSNVSSVYKLKFISDKKNSVVLPRV